jgi:hypothetical protein
LKRQAILKKTRIKKILGVVLGEKSLLTAEVSLVNEAPQVQRLAEMVYPEGITLAQPVELAKAPGGGRHPAEVDRSEAKGSAAGR